MDLNTRPKSHPTPNEEKVLHLQSLREVRKTEEAEAECIKRIRTMDKITLLDEMVRFQEERSKTGHLTLSMIVRGRVLFDLLEKQAETRGLQAITGAYRRHLEHEMVHYLRFGQISLEE